MRNLTGKLAVILLMTGALAMPASAAAPQNKPNGGGVIRPRPEAAVARRILRSTAFSGGRAAFHAPAGRSFTPHVNRSFATHNVRRSFTPHVGSRTVTPRVNSHVTNFANTHRGTTFNSASVPNRHQRGLNS